MSAFNGLKLVAATHTAKSCGYGTATTKCNQPTRSTLAAATRHTATINATTNASTASKCGVFGEKQCCYKKNVSGDDRLCTNG